MAAGEIFDQEQIFYGGKGPQTRHIRAKSIERTEIHPSNRSIGRYRVPVARTRWSNENMRQHLTLHLELLAEHMQTTSGRHRQRIGPPYATIHFTTRPPYLRTKRSFERT